MKVKCGGWHDAENAAPKRIKTDQSLIKIFSIPQSLCAAGPNEGILIRAITTLKLHTIFMAYCISIKLRRLWVKLILMMS